MKGENMLGRIALAVAVIAAVLSCIAATMDVGWVLLPVAFVLGVVAALQSGKSRKAAVAAIVVSVLGAIAVLVDEVSECVVSGPCGAVKGPGQLSVLSGRRVLAQGHSQLPDARPDLALRTSHEISLSRIYGMSCGMPTRETGEPVLSHRL